jgi:molybdopterin-guanine dinucleotide biosynthesis protein A
MCFALPGTRLIKSCEICILAGGLSRRMGRDKNQLLLGRRTMLARVRAAARATGLTVRVIRRDAVQRCGPLGGIYTALKSSRTKCVLFLACDMPFLTAELLRWLLEEATSEKKQPAFVRTRGKAGFPIILPRATMPNVLSQIQHGNFSLQALAETLEATLIRPSRALAGQLRNVNTPAEWKAARRLPRKDE